MSILEQQCSLRIVTNFLFAHFDKKIQEYTKHKNWQQLEQNVIASHENRHEAVKFLVAIFLVLKMFSEAEFLMPVQNVVRFNRSILRSELKN